MTRLAVPRIPCTQGSGGRQCRHAHRSYLMTCDEFAGLDDRAEGRCEICRRPAELSPGGGLYIDHQGGRRWAVRGLLCNPCNTVLTDGREPTPEQRAYLERAWYRGLDLSLRTEPMNVYAVNGRWNMTWRRGRSGWETVLRGGKLTDWPTIWSHNGPHLRVVGARARTD